MPLLLGSAAEGAGWLQARSTLLPAAPWQCTLSHCHIGAACLQVNTSSVVLKKLMEGREGDGVLGGNADVTTR